MSNLDNITTAQLKQILGAFESAIDNECDQQHDMGWDEYCEWKEIDRDSSTDKELDGAFDHVLGLLKVALTQVEENLK